MNHKTPVYRKHRHSTVLPLIYIALSVVPALSQQDSGLKTPAWIQLSFEQRTRYEYLTNQFRLNTDAAAKSLPLRTRLRLELGESNHAVRFLVEFQDSRVLLEEEQVYPVPAHINKHDFLQANLQLNSDNFSSSGIKNKIIVGRFTMDLGKRRLAARNNMRNTTNAFDGISWTLAGNWDWTIHTFLTRPVRIDPNNFDSSGRRYFWGAYFESTHYMKSLVDLYYLGVHDPEKALLRQKFSTFGMRIYKMPSSGTADYEVEAAWQYGKNDDLDHSAWLLHGEAGLSLETLWEPRISMHYDYASGDSDPEDDHSNRFNTLFGARGFEYAPTGIFGPFYRMNIATPGIRIELHPSENIRFTAAYRSYELARSKDAWIGSGLRDSSGDSGKSLGQNLDIRFRWDPNRHLRFSSGYSRLFKGTYLYLVPGSPATDDSNYFYLSTEIRAKLLPY